MRHADRDILPPDNPSHKLSHINDGKYGNRRSWISNEIGKGWMQLEFPEDEELSRVVWSRDRSPKPEYTDRLTTKYEISTSLDGTTWTVVATHADRLPHDYVHNAGPTKVGPIMAAAELSPNELAEMESLSETATNLKKKLEPLKTLPKAYAGQFVTPAKTHRFFRGDPMAPREEIAPGSPSRFGASWELPADAPESDRRRALADWIALPSRFAMRFLP